MGNTGLCLCLAMIPLGIYTPSGGFGIYCCLTTYLREEVIEKYNAEETSICSCPGPLNPICNTIALGINYPCSLFQLLVAMKHWDDEDAAAANAQVKPPFPK